MGTTNNLLPAFLVAAASVLAACGESGGDAPARRVILLSCDTLRSDHLGAYGAEADLTPNLDRFAEQCLVFESAYAAAPLTAPALSSLMTGRYPDELGMRSNKVLLPSQAHTIAETAAAAGLQTAAIVSNWVLRKRDRLEDQALNQGFESYDDDMDASEANRPGVMERDARGTTDAVLAWLGERTTDEFFLWVHYQDPHGPYTPPDEFLGPNADAYKLQDRQQLPLGKTQRGRSELPNYQAIGDERDPGYYLERYRAEVRYFDHEIGRLIQALEDEHLLEDALLIFTADHGESLGEHNWWFSHGQTLYDELVRVPLLVRGPGQTSGGRVERIAGHVDVMATVAAALGTVAPPTHGVDLLSGALPQQRVLAQHLRTPGTSSRWESLTDERWRLIKHPAGVLLFERASDPTESVNLAQRHPEAIRDLEQRYLEQTSGVPNVGATAVDANHSAEELEQLNALGYSDDGDED